MATDNTRLVDIKSTETGDDWASQWGFARPMVKARVYNAPVPGLDAAAAKILRNSDSLRAGWAGGDADSSLFSPEVRKQLGLPNSFDYVTGVNPLLPDWGIKDWRVAQGGGNSGWFKDPTFVSGLLSVIGMAAAPFLTAGASAAGGGAEGAAGGAVGGTGLTAPAGALVPSSLAYAPAVAPSATIGGGALGSGLTGVAGGAAAGMGLGQGLAAPAGTLVPAGAGAAVAPSASMASKAGNLLSSPGAKAVKLVSNILGLAGGGAAMKPNIPNVPGAQETPNVPNVPNPPSPDTVLSETKAGVVEAAKRRRGRSATILTLGAGTPYETFGNP